METIGRECLGFGASFEGSRLALIKFLLRFRKACRKVLSEGRIEFRSGSKVANNQVR